MSIRERSVPAAASLSECRPNGGGPMEWCRGPGRSSAGLASRRGGALGKDTLFIFYNACLCATVLLAPDISNAGDGTWAGPGAEWTTGSNWSSNPTVLPSIATIEFTVAAPSYSFTLQPFSRLLIAGAGIVNNSSNAPTFLLPGITTELVFNSGTAGNAIITNSGFQGLTIFNNSSTAGNATIINNNSAVNFIRGPGSTTFNDTSTAGHARITSADTGFVSFLGMSTAGTATILANSGGTTSFDINSSAGSADIITNGGGTTTFNGASTGGNALITTNSGGITKFFGSSTGGLASFVTNSGGVVDISTLAVPPPG
jgi:hypothetical protein